MKKSTKVLSRYNIQYTIVGKEKGMWMTIETKLPLISPACRHYAIRLTAKKLGVERKDFIVHSFEEA